MNNINPSFYKLLFDQSPVSIWVEDFSAVYKYILCLKEEGVSNIRSYFSTYPDKFLECIGLLRIVDINRATLKLYKASSKEQLFSQIGSIFRDEAINCLLESVVALAEGKHSFEGQGINYDLDGNTITFRISWTITGVELADYEKVIVVIQDLSRLVKTRSELEEREARFRCIFEQSSEGMALIERSGKFIQPRIIFL